MAIDPAALNALTASWAAAKADLDDSENRTKINYNNAVENLRRQNLQGMGQIGVGAADRGLAQSGIRGQQELKQQDEFNRESALRAQQQQLALSTIARKRLEADAQLNANKGLLQSQGLAAMQGVV